MFYLVLKNTEKQHICKNVHRRDLAKSLTSEQYVFCIVDRAGKRAIGQTEKNGVLCGRSRFSGCPP